MTKSYNNNNNNNNNGTYINRTRAQHGRATRLFDSMSLPPILGSRISPSMSQSPSRVRVGLYPISPLNPTKYIFSRTELIIRKRARIWLLCRFTKESTAGDRLASNLYHHTDALDHRKGIARVKWSWKTNLFMRADEHSQSP